MKLEFSVRIPNPGADHRTDAEFLILSCISDLSNMIVLQRIPFSDKLLSFDRNPEIIA